MTTSLLPGKSGEPVPSGEQVLRLFKPSKDGRVTDTAFELTSLDKASPLQALSVWVVSLTTPAQARVFMGEQSVAYSQYALLNVDAIRALRLSPMSEETPLNVVWDTLLMSGTILPDTRSGAEGHAGITGLLRPPGMDKALYKRLRVQLADLANAELYSLE